MPARLFTGVDIELLRTKKTGPAEAGTGCGRNQPEFPVWFTSGHAPSSASGQVPLLP